MFVLNEMVDFFRFCGIMKKIPKWKKTEVFYVIIWGDRAWADGI